MLISDLISVPVMIVNQVDPLQEVSFQSCSCKTVKYNESTFIYMFQFMWFYNLLRQFLLLAKFMVCNLYL